MSPSKERLKALVGVFIALALVLSVAQNIHYFIKYNSSIATLLIFVGNKDSTPATKQIKEQLQKALIKEEENKKDNTSTAGVIDDLIKEAQKHGISKQILMLEIRERLEWWTRI